MIMQLSDAQLAVLEPALGRADRCIYPIVAKLKGGAVGNVAASLLKRGLLEEVPAADDTTVWRCLDDGTPVTLRATEQAVQVGDGRVAGPPELAVEPDAVKCVNAPKRGAGQVALLAALQRPGGATIGEMQAATGWLAHSVRGALSGVIAKKLGHKISSVKENDRGRVYRIADQNDH